MNIIADTSVWIEFLKFNQAFFYSFKEKLERLEIYGIECVFSELLQGIKSDRELDLILKYWENIPKLNEKNIMLKAGIYSYKNNLISKGIGLIDSVLITLAKDNDLKIWTLDKKIINNIEPDLIYFEIK